MSPVFTKWLGLLVLAACGCTFVASALSAQPAGAPTKEELADAAKWVDRLDWPDLRGKAYVELTFGQATQNSKVIEGLKMRGFLLAEDETNWTVFCDGTDTNAGYWGGGESWPLSTAHLPKPKADAEPSTRTSIRVLELSKAVDEVLKALHQREEEQPDQVDRFGARVTEQTALFLLARCCARQDRTALAARLEEEVVRLAARREQMRSPAESFRETLERDLSTLFMWKAVLDFGRPSITRPELLKEFKEVVRLFPGSKHSERAAGYVEQLGPMVTEDQAHAVAAQPIDKMTPEEQVREWIFRLRDQHGEQWGQPGACDIFSDDYGNRPEKSPAHHLVQLGHSAVPALIEALRDARPTRSVGYHRDFYFSHFVLTIGDCAAAILSRIAGQQFWIAHTTYGAMQKDGETEGTRKEVEAWWARVRDKGEKTVLIENVSAGGRDSAEQAGRLATLDPAAAITAIEAGLTASTEYWVKSNLVGWLASIKTEAATAALRKQLRDSPSLQVRVVAALAVVRRGGSEVIPAMIEEWRKWQPASGDEGSTGNALIVLLASCDDPAALKALTARFPQLPIEMKLEVIEALTPSGGGYDSARAEGKTASPEIQALSQELLIGALEDRAVRYGMSGTRSGPGGSFSYHDPRVCELAAAMLAANWPERYHFDWPGTQFERDISLVEMRNVWRAAHAQPPLPLPELPSHEAAAREPNTVAAVQWAGGEALRDFPITVGQPLTAESVVAALLQLQREQPQDRAGFSFLAERPGSPHGFLVQIRWESEKEHRNPCSWNFNTNIGIGGESLHNSSGSSSLQPRDKNEFAEERRALLKVLAGEPNLPITISYRGALGQ